MTDDDLIRQGKQTHDLRHCDDPGLPCRYADRKVSEVRFSGHGGHRVPRDVGYNADYGDGENGSVGTALELR